MEIGIYVFSYRLKRPPLSKIRSIEMKKFSLLKLEETVGALGLAVMVTIAFINVLTRYVFKYSMAFTEELTLYIFVWITLMGTAIAFREGSSMAVTLFYNMCPKGCKRVLFVIANICTVIFMGLMTYYGAVEIFEEIEMEATTESMSLPVWWFTISIPIGSFLAIIGTLQRAWEEIKNGEV